MINVVLAISGFHGWGVVGSQLTRALNARTPVHLFTGPLSDPGLSINPIEQRYFERLATVITTEAVPMISAQGPVLQILTPTLRPAIALVRGDYSVGYTVFEKPEISPSDVQRARQDFNRIAVASNWCADILRHDGIPDVGVAHQGIDPSLFNPQHNQRDFLTDQFIVFSGGKLEYRKGQDLVIRAFKVLQDRHKDVMLVAAWFNLWPKSIQSMTASPYLKFPPAAPTTDFPGLMRQLLHVNGIDLSRAIVLGSTPNSMMPQIYKNTDIGLFPNRCEGGTNLVLMEYLACGKTAIVSRNSGHLDVTTDEYTLPLNQMKQAIHPLPGSPEPFIFYEPDLEETIEALESAYQNRGKLAPLAAAAAQAMTQFTWQHTADRILSLLYPNGLPSESAS